MILFVMLGLMFAAVFAAAGVVVGTLALAFRAALWLVLFPFRVVFSLIALPLMLVGIVGAALVGALFVGLGVLVAAALSVALPLGLIFGACWLIARAMRGPAVAKVV
jgi:hypothetical protein